MAPDHDHGHSYDPLPPRGARGDAAGATRPPAAAGQDWWGAWVDAWTTGLTAPVALTVPALLEALGHSTPPSSPADHRAAGLWADPVLAVGSSLSLGEPATARLAQQRAAQLLGWVQQHSRFYRVHHTPAGAQPRWSDLPVVDKRLMMAHFDDWVTDPHLTLERVRGFAADPENLGELLDGRYAVWSSSGTSGEPALYLKDRASLNLYEQLLQTRMDRRCASGRWWWQAAAGRLGPWGLQPRSALITAIDGPYASISFWMRQLNQHPWLRSGSRAFSVTWPGERLREELNRWQPSFIASYPSMLTELARWQRDGRLKLAPLALWSGGERLVASTRQWIEEVFQAPVVNDYGASECLSIAFECSEGRLHLNDDWVILEPVDRAGQPVPPGVPSHSVLLTHLANRIQPLIRYDLGDSVTFFADRCACGNPRPSFLVEGRTDDSLCLDDGQGHRVHLAPMALTTAVEDGADVHRFQLRQTTPDGIELRLDLSRSAEPERTRGAAVTSLRRYLAAEGLPRARIDLSDEPPLLDARSGKLRQVVCLCPARG